MAIAPFNQFLTTNVFLKLRTDRTDRIITSPPPCVTLLVPGAKNLDKNHFDIHIFAVIII